jgi:hypothetical protein
MRRTITLIAALWLAATLTLACADDDDTPPAPPATVPALAATETPLPAAITIDAPAAGETLTVPFEVSGGANVFEAALVVDVLGNAAGLVLCRRHVQATSGTGTPGTWSATMAFPPPEEDAAVTIRAFDYSARDGSEENVVERAITVLAEQPNIVIESPRCSDVVRPGAMLVVRGNAQVFEAALSVELRDASGAAFLTQSVLADSGVERSPWSATLDLSSLPEGSGLYDLVAYSHSAEDGSIINEFAVPILVQTPSP